MYNGVYAKIPLKAQDELLTHYGAKSLSELTYYVEKFLGGNEIVCSVPEVSDYSCVIHCPAVDKDTPDPTGVCRGCTRRLSGGDKLNGFCGFCGTRITLEPCCKDAWTPSSSPSA